MITLAVSLTTWLVWAIVGIVAGYMTGRLVARGSAALYVIIGIIGAVAGGWAFTAACGDSDDQQIISLITSLAASGVLLWVTTLIAGKKNPDDDTDI